MNKTSISVIMPVFNTREYLEAAILSILDQTIDGIELIIVDDGSTDSSPEIIKWLASTNSSISYIRQINSGQAVARNRALESAKGEFIYFMDSDDLLDKDALEKCYNLAKDKNLDLVLFDAENFGEITNSGFAGFSYDRSAVLSSNKIYTGREVLKTLLQNRVFRASPCLHFIKREVIYDNNLLFTPGIIHEDELYSPYLYLNSARVGYIPQKFFKRRIRENSTMSSKFSDKNLKGYYTTITEYRRIVPQDIEENLIKRLLIKNVANGIAYQSGITFGIKKRAGVLLSLIRNKCLTALTFKNLLILLFPFTIKIKSLFK